jgi:nitrile hydratase accessory protein
LELSLDLDLKLADELQPPMANGEVMFDEPWQSRIFGMALALHEAGHFSWAEFQECLIAVIGEWDASHDGADPYEYYAHFEQALHKLLEAKQILDSQELVRRTRDLAARPHGHDH